jgi:hypothetical protein
MESLVGRAGSALRVCMGASRGPRVNMFCSAPVAGADGTACDDIDMPKTGGGGACGRESFKGGLRVASEVASGFDSGREAELCDTARGTVVSSAAIPLLNNGCSSA